eukprot:PLAT9161.2.p1 GENE.PLAT9161.2~~PLAT9161.2.p1  ORF type:complete len:449 (-),score=153.38 PLAT9161.2:48-1358(-)
MADVGEGDSVSHAHAADDKVGAADACEEKCGDDAAGARESAADGVQWEDGEAFDVVIVGGGQSGLCTAYSLKQHAPDASVLVLDASEQVGGVWRRRYDSLRLFSPARFSRLPAVPQMGADGAFPTKDEVADALQALVEQEALPWVGNARVTDAHWLPEGAWQLTVAGRPSARARMLVIATGPHNCGWRPEELASSLPASIVQMHSCDYQRPSQVSEEGNIAVIGAGASGVAIAGELAAAASARSAAGGALQEVYLFGRNVGKLPRRVFGADLYWWLHKTGALTTARTTAVGRAMMSSSVSAGDPLIGSALADAKDAGVIYRSSKLVRCAADQRSADWAVLTAADGAAALGVHTVIWATGFRTDYSWLHVPPAEEGEEEEELVDEAGLPRTLAGCSSVAPALYFVGQRWLHTGASSLLYGMPADADMVAQAIAECLG